jgi:hypothetical protein
MTAGLDVPEGQGRRRGSPRPGRRGGRPEEVLADETALKVKAGLTAERSAYLG